MAVKQDEPSLGSKGQLDFHVVHCCFGELSNFLEANFLD